MNKLFRIYFSPESNSGNPGPDPIKSTKAASIKETETEDEKSKQVNKPSKKK